MKKTTILGFCLILALALVTTVALTWGPGFGPMFGRGFGGEANGVPPIPGLTTEQSAQIEALRDGFRTRAAVEKVLQVSGYDNLYSESGKHAVPKIREGSFGIIVTDFQMRGMNGLKLIREARRIKLIEWDERVGFLDALRLGK